VPGHRRERDSAEEQGTANSNREPHPVLSPRLLGDDRESIPVG
jgi:hypothetical protein